MEQSNKNTFLLFCLSVIGFISCYLLNGYLAHHLSIYIYADYSVALKFLDFMVCITLFGTDVSSVCYLSKYLLNNQNLTLEEYIRWNIKLVSVNILILRVVSWLLFIGVLVLHVLGIRRIESYSILVFVVWIAPFAASFRLICSFLTGLDLFISSTMMSSVLVYLVQFLLFAGLIGFLKLSLSYENIALVLAGTYAILTLFCYELVDKRILGMMKQGVRQFFVTPVIHLPWFSSVLKIIVNSMLFMGVCSMDLFIVRIFSSNPKDTGCYAAILSIISLLFLIPKSLYQDLKPLLSFHLMSQEGRLLIQKQINHTNKIVFFLLTTIALVIIFSSRMLLNYFGHEYLSGQKALIFLTIGLWYTGLNQLSGMILIYANLEGLALKGCLLQVFFVLCITIPATYYFGINGTAISTGMSFVLNSLYCSFQTKKHLGLNSMIIPGYMPPVS